MKRPGAPGMDREAPLPPGRWKLSGLLGLAILGISTAAPLIRLSHAPPLALAFWRMALATGLMGALWTWNRGKESASPGGGDLGKKAFLLGLSGVFLGIHFALWVLSLSLTTVAVSVVLVNTQPVFAALLSWVFLGEPPTGRQAAGIGTALGGVILMTGATGFYGAGLLGALLALGGAFSGSCYYVVGRGLRPRMGLWAYVTPVYGVSALLLLALSLAFHAPLGPFPAREWAIFAALAAAPTLFGHTLLNWALRWLPAPVVNVVALGEPVGASLLAALIPAIGEVPGTLTLLGGGVTLLGIFLALGGDGQGQRGPARG